jgi:hypothetical protein
MYASMVNDQFTDTAQVTAAIRSIDSCFPCLKGEMLADKNMLKSARIRIGDLRSPIISKMPRFYSESKMKDAGKELNLQTDTADRAIVYKMFSNEFDSELPEFPAFQLQITYTYGINPSVFYNIYADSEYKGEKFSGFKLLSGYKEFAKEKLELPDPEFKKGALSAFYLVTDRADEIPLLKNLQEGKPLKLELQYGNKVIEHVIPADDQKKMVQLMAVFEKMRNGSL